MRGVHSRAKSIHKTNVAGVECAQGSQQEMGSVRRGLAPYGKAPSPRRFRLDC